MTRVEKLVTVTRPYTLNNNHQWSQFPDMSGNIDVPFAQYIEIKYNIQYWQTKASGYFITRVLVDGRENMLFRICTGYTIHHSHVISDEVWMEKGPHNVQVQYRTNVVFPNFGLHDWNIAAFKIRYFQP